MLETARYGTVRYSSRGREGGGGASPRYILESNTVHSEKPSGAPRSKQLHKLFFLERMINREGKQKHDLIPRTKTQSRPIMSCWVHVTLPLIVHLFKAQAKRESKLLLLLQVCQSWRSWLIIKSCFFCTEHRLNTANGWMRGWCSSPHFTRLLDLVVTLAVLCGGAGTTSAITYSQEITTRHKVIPPTLPENWGTQRLTHDQQVAIVVPSFFMLLSCNRPFLHLSVPLLHVSYWKDSPLIGGVINLRIRVRISVSSFIRCKKETNL